MALLVHIRQALDGFHPGAFNALLAVLLWLAMYGWRRFWPASFDRLPLAAQAWPALVTGALLSALSTGLGPNPVDALVAVLGQTLGGLLSGIAGVGLHRVLKESALAYGGQPAVDDRAVLKRDGVGP